MTKQTKNAPTAEQLAAIANEAAAELHAMRLEKAAQALSDFLSSDAGKEKTKTAWENLK